MITMPTTRQNDEDEYTDVALVSRLEHYFRTYKLVGGARPDVSIEGQYGRDHAYKVIEASISDYQETFGDSARI